MANLDGTDVIESENVPACPNCGAIVSVQDFGAISCTKCPWWGWWLRPSDKEMLNGTDDST